MQFSKLDDSHDKKAFDCGNDIINHYLKNMAKQHAKKGISKTHILHKDSQILGFYTLSNLHIENNDNQIKGYPRQIPAILIGKMGVDMRYQGQGLSKLLLSQALKHIKKIADETGIAFAIIDAKDESLASYYEKFSFQRSQNSLRLMIPVNII